MKRIRNILAMLCGVIIIALPSIVLAAPEPVAPTTTTNTTPQPAPIPKPTATPKAVAKPAAAPAVAATSTCDPGSNTAKSQVLAGAGQTGADCTVAEKSISNLIGSIVQILSIVVGIVAVIMIIVSGFKYVTSSGDSNKIANAKSTLIYALVGLVIAALAQVLIHFTFNVVGDTALKCKYNSKISASNSKCVAP